jgi:4-amino-4-deoxy-L-arabinose transferase-like glycosyltransferase
MDKFLHKFRFVLLLLILCLSLFLRNDKINTWPRLGATFDEYAWTWLGMNLIQNHIPESWSPHAQYTNRKHIVYQQANFNLVKPYLEHPPLFGLVAGSYALISGVKTPLEINIQSIRGLALLLGVLSIFILYVFAAEIYGYKIGLIAAAIYATVPTIVIGSRIVQNENFFIPLFLTSLLLTYRYIKTNKSFYRNLAAIVCGLLILAKIPWIAAALSIVLILFYLKKYKDAFKFLAIVLPIFSLFFIYGAYYDWNLFISLWKLQLARYDLAFNSIFALFTSPYLVDRFMIDGWIYFGWFSIFLLSLKDFKKNYMVLLPFLGYFAIYVFGIPNEPSHGWYRYPFYPFLVISTALFLKEYFTKNHLLTFLFLIFTGLSLLQLSWAQSIGFSYLIFRSYLVLFGISLAPLFLPRTEKISYISSYLSLFIVFFLNIWSVFKYNEQ